MATIKIRGRGEPVIVSDDVAKKVKNRKFGNGVAQAEPTELVDLGSWSGEYGRIVEIEITREDAKDHREEERRIENDKLAKFRAQAPEVKAKVVGWFKVLYASRSGDWHAKPSQELLDKVIALHTKLYKENPMLMPMHIGPKLYGDLLPKQGTPMKLADSMRIVHDAEPDIYAF